MKNKKINKDVKMPVKQDLLAATVYCYSYHRISTTRQLTGGGIRRQMEASQEICDEKGWTMDTSFKLTDIGKSAYSGKNLDDKAALGSFLNAVDAGLIKRPAVLLVESLDRLSRANILDALELFIRIINTGITIYTSIDRMTYSRDEIQQNFSPLLISITMMSRSHEESETKSKRIKKSWRQMEDDLREGMLGRSTIYPFWIDISSGKPKVLKDEAKVVKDVFQFCTKDNMSMLDISNAIKKKHGKKYMGSTSQVQRILYSKKVLGFYEAKDKSLIKAFPAVIDEKTFYLAQSMAAKRKVLMVGRPQKRAINFFKKILLCGDCGRTMCNSASGTSSAYVCYSKQNKMRCDQKSALGVNKLQSVLFYALSLIDKKDMLEKAGNTERAKLSKQINIREAELLEKMQRVENLVELVSAKSKTGIKATIKLEAEIELLEQEMEFLSNKLHMLSSPSMAGTIVKIKEFHKRFILEKADKSDQEPFITSLQHVVEKIVIHSPDEGYRTKVFIHLLSGVKLKLMVEKDYSTNVYRGNIRIGRYTAPPQKNRRLKTTPHGNIKHGRRSKYQ